MALLLFIPSRKTVEVLCFLVLAFAHTGYFFGDECPAESSLLCGVPPLDCQQIQQIRDAIADGTVDRIQAALEADGPIFVGNSSFPPIVQLTEAQMCAIERCFGGFDPIPPDGSVRRKRGTGAQTLSCSGNPGEVRFTALESNGFAAQVAVNNMPSTTSCTGPNAGTSCTGCCCKQTLHVQGFGIGLIQNIGTMFPGNFAVQHCTCCN